MICGVEKDKKMTIVNIFDGEILIRDGSHRVVETNISLFVGELPDYKKSMIEAYYNLIKQLENHPDSLVKKGVESLKENKWLVEHPDYMGGWKKSDMP